jgi:phosphoribosylamine--glycine ligase
MKTLVIGAGGREHSIIKALRKSYSTNKASSEISDEIYAYPGNGGIFQEAKSLLGDTSLPQTVLNVSEISDLAKKKQIELIVIGPESELVEGYADYFRDNGFLVFGPSKAAAQLEGSKIFAKKFMDEFGIPTAAWSIVSSVNEVDTASAQFAPPYVLKADGLAAGKGVFICKDKKELLHSARLLFEEKIFNEAGSTAILEQFKAGKELSLLALTNGSEYQILPFCRDHKRLLANDEGPNTGGMGVIAPLDLPESLIEDLKIKVLKPTMDGFLKRKFSYRGVVFIGVMLTDEGPSVLEYNVRFGDPETQVIMPLLDMQWAPILKAVALGKLPSLSWKRDLHVACVVLAAENYPMNPVKGAVISGLEGEFDSAVQVVHAGTKMNNENQFVVTGGRVLNIVATGSALSKALEKSYQAIQKISWRGMQFRKDIGK